MKSGIPVNQTFNDSTVAESYSLIVARNTMQSIGYFGYTLLIRFFVLRYNFKQHQFIDDEIGLLSFKVRY